MRRTALVPLLARSAAGALPGLVFATVVLAGFGSSSKAELVALGLPFRWLALLALAATAALAFAAARPPFARPARATGVGVALLAFASLSIAWSPAPQLSAQRVATVWAVLVAVACTAWLAARARGLLEAVLVALVAAGTVLALGGLVLIGADPAAAFQSASGGVEWRFRGLGQNPNTVPLLVSVVLPLAVHAVQRSRGRVRALAVAAVAVMCETIFISGSRGAILASFTGVAVLLAVSRRALRWRLRRLLVLLLVTVAGVFSGSLLQAVVQVGTGAVQGTTLKGLVAAAASDPTTTTNACAGTAPGPSAPAPSLAAPAPSQAPAVSVVRPRGRQLLAGLVVLVPRSNTLLSGSGRTEAWGAAAGLVRDRPLAGHGFGSEATVFAPLACNFEVFQGGRVENSYLGAAVELGGVGALLLVALLAAVAAAARRALRTQRGRPHALVAALAGTVAAGATSALFQSYLFSAGNIAMLAFWMSAALLVAVPAARRGARRPPARLLRLPPPRRQRLRSGLTLTRAVMLLVVIAAGIVGAGRSH